MQRTRCERALLVLLRINLIEILSVSTILEIRMTLVYGMSLKKLRFKKLRRNTILCCVGGHPSPLAVCGVRSTVHRGRAPKATRKDSSYRREVQRGLLLGSIGRGGWDEKKKKKKKKKNKQIKTILNSETCKFIPPTNQLRSHVPDDTQPKK